MISQLFTVFTATSLFVLNGNIQVNALPPPSGGWSPQNSAPTLPSINVNLTNDYMFSTLGLTGGASSSQQIYEGANGSSSAPASLSSSSSNSAVLGVSGATGAVAVVDVSDQSVDTINSVDASAVAAGTEGVDAVLNGVNATVVYSGESSVPLAGGVTFAEAETEVEIMQAVE